MPADRRTVLKAIALSAMASATGCGGSERPVRVAVVWSGEELLRFREVLAEFTDSEGWPVTVRSMGDDVDALLSSQVARSTVPDVAIIPRPGLVRQHASRLEPPSDWQASQFPLAWRELINVAGTDRGIWFKSAHKSLVWYRSEVLDSPPADWAGWVQLSMALRDSGHTPLALGAADGWVLTDWFENVLLGVDADVYRGLAAGRASWRDEAVEETLTALGDFWIKPGMIAGGPERALLTQFEDAVTEVFHHRRAVMVAGADFTGPVIERFSPGARHGRFPFPPVSGGAPVLVGGDVAVLLRPASDGGKKLRDWLASGAAAPIWARHGGFLSANLNVPRDGFPEPYAELNDQIRNSAIEFDLSDRLGGRLSGGEGRGLGAILQEFLADLTPGRRGSGSDRAAVGRAVDHAVDRLAREAAQ